MLSLNRQISAVLGNSEIMDVLTPGTHGSTYGGNPLACKIAKASLEVIINEGLVENAFKMGEIFRSELTARLDKDKVVQVRGKGLLNAIVLNTSTHIFHIIYFIIYYCTSIESEISFVIHIRIGKISFCGIFKIIIIKTNL